MTENYALADPGLTLERAKLRIEEQNVALADLRAEVRTLGNTVARTEKALWAERELLADARRHVSDAWGEVRAARELTLLGHLKVWWARRPVWRV